MEGRQSRRNLEILQEKCYEFSLLLDDSGVKIPSLRRACRVYRTWSPSRKSTLSARGETQTPGTPVPHFQDTTMNVIDKIEREQLKSDVPNFGPGDTVKVHTRVIESGKERIQIYQGIVLSRHGIGVNQAFTVRKISNSEGVERVFPIHSPKVAKVEVVQKGKVRRAKLNYLRGRIGKQAMQVKQSKKAKDA